MEVNMVAAPLFTNIINAAVFAAIGVVLFIVAFYVFDKMTPGSLWKELLEEHNVAIANLMAGVAIAIAIIIAASIV
jgi:putative membrane protein